MFCVDEAYPQFRDDLFNDFHWIYHENCEDFHVICDVLRVIHCVFHDDLLCDVLMNYGYEIFDDPHDVSHGDRDVIHDVGDVNDVLHDDILRSILLVFENHVKQLEDQRILLREEKSLFYL